MFGHALDLKILEASVDIHRGGCCWIEMGRRELNVYLKAISAIVQQVAELRHSSFTKLSC
jgi:hypothetical protein